MSDTLTKPVPALRKYDLDEIDRIRRYVGYLFKREHQYPQPPPTLTEIEERVRTYMMNGTDPAELKQKALLLYDAELTKILSQWNPEDRDRFLENEEPNWRDAW